MEQTVPIIRGIFREDERMVVDFTHSANLSLTESQGLWCETVLAAKHYRRSVYEPLSAAEVVLPQLLSAFLDEHPHHDLTVIDCGPASPEESVRKLEILSTVATIVRYVAIDVNSLLLSRIQAGVSQRFGISVHLLQSRFEDLEKVALRDRITGNSLLLFGSTGLNFEAYELTTLFRHLCPRGTLIS